MVEKNLDKQLQKLESGSYRFRKMINGKRYSIVFDHKPSQKEIREELYLRYRIGSSDVHKPIKNCVLEYIESRSNVCSPSTIRSYNSMLRAMSDRFANMNIFSVTQIDIQNEINAYAKDHSPKSVRNYHGLISAVFGTFRSDMIIRTTLPQKKPSRYYKPTENDVRRILDASADSKYHIAFQLGVMGLRRGEVAGINIETDLDGNKLLIHQVLCESDNGWVLKDIPKNDSSNREIILPQSLVDEINEQGYIVDTSPPMIVEQLHKYQDNLGIPRFRFHDLRHYFASYLHSVLNIPDKYIQMMGGWKDSTTLDRIYKSTMSDKEEEILEIAANKLLS